MLIGALNQDTLARYQLIYLTPCTLYSGFSANEYKVPPYQIFRYLPTEYKGTEVVNEEARDRHNLSSRKND